MSTTVTYKGETLTTVTNDTVTLETAGTWVEDDFTLTDTTSGGTMQAKSNIDPTTSSQTIEPDEGYDGLSSVQINAMPTGTAGTPTATKGAVSNHSIAVTPSVTNTTGYITGSTINGTAVTVSASELDSGSKSITANGNSQDVVGYASVDVAVPNSYSASDEGKVVSSGALVAQTAHADVTPTTSDQTIDTTTNNSLKVKGDADLIATNIKKDVEIFGVTGSYEGGGGGVSGFDLLDDITISQAVRSYQIDFQNAWYSYDRILIYINGQFSGGSDWLYWNVNATTLDSGKYSSSISAFEFMYEVISAPYATNPIKVDILSIYNSGHISANVNISNLTSMDAVSYFWFSGYSKDLATGTKIKIYGVKYADL